ncbi:hypothetical protein E8D34_15960 [Nocardioides sp. GY 10113]|uniref:hypothetical protein n=1 Tax=Nocardioides sp. GY 10113 TaxID=2569761 RepID=UPI0010A924CE|nr:hypothetical protein [Nocardioides sp. GY 10113]TIC83617.1 hypothetical protein E8D34_15960 [Nocardioides sp. GY 10113]
MSALHILVHRAYVGKAHLALGYARWADYVASEFEMSRARSYQLLGQHEVITALSRAAGTDVSDIVTEKVARDIKPHLAAVSAEVADRSRELGDQDQDQILTVVAEVLNATRRPDADRLNRMPSMAKLRASQARGNSTDLWYTPRTAVAPLLAILPPPPLRVWAHADVRGRSHIVDVLEEAGYDVVCSDLSTGQDFFTFTAAEVEAMGVDVAVTNPPYSVRRRWLAHLVDLGLPFALLVPETGVGEWAFEPLRTAGAEAGLLLLNRRIAFSQRWGERPVGNPPFSSGWVCRGLLPAGQQLVFGEVPATY